MRGLRALLVVGLLHPHGAQAEAAAFVATCLAAADDFARLPQRLAADGWVERDPDQGPRGPASAQAPAGRRLWSSRAARRETFVGYTAAGPDQPMEVCWLIGRPGEDPASSLAALKDRFPPRAGSIETGTAMFYGGFERWPARVAGADVVLGVEWPFRDRPASGVGDLYVIKPRAAPGGSGPAR